jgi:cytochrome c peroxidase
MHWFAWLLSAYLLFSGCDSSTKENLNATAQMALGKKLFFETRLSLNGQTSCASCHLPSHGFAEPVPARAIGFNLSRNTPGLWAVGKRKRLHWDGGVPDLESQALGPLQSMEELGLNLKIGVKRLAQDPFYQSAFQFAFGGPPEVGTLVQALAAFQRSLDPLAFLDAQRMKAFKPHFNLFLKVGCGKCHIPPYFFKDEFMRLNEEENDPGRGRITGRVEDEGKFRIPSLWAVGLTAPYFHNGQFPQISDAIQGHGTYAPSLSKEQMDSIVYFLSNLTPQNIIPQYKE